MYVRNHMIPASKVITLTENHTLKDALELMSLHGHDALPVLRGTQVVGVISKQHIYKTFFLNDFPSKSDYLEGTNVSEQMKTDYRTVNPNDLLEYALQTMAKMKMQFLCIIDSKGNLVGLLTKQQLLGTLGNSLGLGKRGIRLEIVLDDIEGRLATLTKLISKAKVNIISIIMVDPSIMDLRKIVLRLDTRDKDSIVAIIEKAGFKVLDANVQD